MAAFVRVKAKGKLFDGKMLERFFDQVKKPMTECLLIFQSEAVKRSPVDTGSLRASIVPVLPIVKKGPLRVEGLTTAKAPHGVPVAKGARPNPAAPAAPIAEWAERKGVDPGRAINAVRRKGTPANPFWDEAFDDAQSVCVKRMNKFLEAFLRREDSS